MDAGEPEDFGDELGVASALVWEEEDEAFGTALDDEA
jgi:hypothetical protein